MAVENTPVSVVLYVHDGEPYLSMALDSILAQTHRNFELCVVDDGSTDGTSKILARVAEADSRVRVHRQDARGRTRLHETFNATLAMVRHDLIAIANADDIWMADKLERQLQVFSDDPALDVCYHEATFIDAAERVMFKSFRRHPSPYPTAPPRPWQFVSGNPIPNPTVMFRRAILRRIGLQEVGDMHDHQFWFKATVAGCRFFGMPDRLIRYRVHDGSHSTAASRHEAIREAHRACSAAMVARYAIEQLVPELALVDPGDMDSKAWAHSFIAGALWSVSAFDAAGEQWRRAVRYADDPAILCGLGMVARREGNDRESNRLLQLAAEAGVGHARVLLADSARAEAMSPPLWHGREPRIAGIKQETDRVGLSLQRDLQPAPFDVVLMLPDSGDFRADLPDTLARELISSAKSACGVRVVSLATGDDDIAVLSGAYDIARRTDPTIDQRLHIEVDVVPSAQQRSVVEAHRLDGAAIRV